jgi:ABC-type antimicrobial peptide transport system permease subunit
MFLAVRTSGDDPSVALAPLKRILRQSNPSFGIRDVTTGGALVGQQLSRPRFLADTLVALAGAALFLSAVGLYGLLAAAVRERRREIAIRIALGATPAEVRALIVRQAAYILALGIVVGTALSYAGTRLLGSVLYEVRTTDPLTFAGVVVALVVTAGVAAYAPAARAAHVDPASTLGAE